MNCKSFFDTNELQMILLYKCVANDSTIDISCKCFFDINELKMILSYRCFANDSTQ